VKLILIRTAKGKNKWADQATEGWKKRFVHRLPFSEHILKPAPAHLAIEERRKRESQKVRQLLHQDDYLVVLDERGSLWSTEQLHKKVTQAMNRSTKRMVFVIGGPFGHDVSLRESATEILSISNMVLNHEIARICLVEQIYRVYTLIYGGDYHH
jgi:23S rRNA (pseudouridine1915-N3)-methyltransferase